MSRKAESIYTSRKLNKANREKLEAAAEKQSRMSNLDRFVEENANRDVCYVNVSGVSFPLGRDCKNSFLTKQISILTI